MCKCELCGSTQTVRRIAEWLSTSPSIQMKGSGNPDVNKRPVCHTCWYWLEQHTIGGGVIVGKVHYRIGESTSFKGFGGRKFKLLFEDGQILETDNLWYQGVVPERFLNMFENHATFLPIEEEVNNEF